MRGYGIHIDGLVQDCSNTIVNALELPQSCTKPSNYEDNLIHNVQGFNHPNEFAYLHVQHQALLPEPMMTYINCTLKKKIQVKFWLKFV